MVQAEKNRLSVHRLKPYTSWSDYSVKIEAALSAYIKHIGFDGVSRIGLRYINEIRGAATDFKDVFNLYIELPRQVEGELQSFFSGMLLKVKDDDSLRINVGDQRDEAAKFFVLDLDYFKDTPIQPKEAAILEWTHSAHSVMDNLFEALLTSQMKGVFDK